MATAPVTLKFSSYDLKQDLVEEEENLGNQSIVKNCSLIYKRNDIVEEMLKIWNKIGSYDPSFNPMMTEWMCIIKTAENALHNEIKLSSDEIKKQANDINCFMGMQIYNFYWKSVKQNELALFLRNFVFTPRGTINTYRTIERILAKDDLSFKQKFVLSCKYFMGINVIKKYFNELPDEVKTWFLKFKKPNCEACIPLYYWSRTIQGKMYHNFILQVESSEDDLSDYSDLNINAKFLTWAVKAKNEIAVQYLWENLISTWPGKSTILNGLGVDFMDAPKRNIFMYLLTKWTDDDSSEWTRYINYILPVLFEDSRWHEYYVNAVEFLQSKASFSYFPTLNTIISKMNESLYSTDQADEKYWGILKDCLIIMPSQEKFLDFFKLTEILDENAEEILSPAFTKMDFDLIKKLVRVYKEADVSNLFYIETGIAMLSIVAKNEAFDFINIILKEFSKSDDEYELLKERFFGKSAFIICESLVLCNELETLGKFIDWLSKSYSLNKANELKASLPFSFNSTILKQLICNAAGIIKVQHSSPLKLRMEQSVSKNTEYEFLFGNIDAFLSLCLASEEEILQTKQSIFEINKKLPDYTQFYEVYTNLILNGKFDFLSKLCEWSQCSEETKRNFRNCLPVDAEIMKKFRDSNNLEIFFKYLEWLDFGADEA